MGDILQHCGWANPPLTRFRFHNIVTDEVQDLEPLKQVAGSMPYDIEEGVRITVGWMIKNRRILKRG